MSRRIEDLIPPMQIAYGYFKKQMEEVGLLFIVTRTLSSLAEQTALYAQGRESLENVNALRNKAGLGKISAPENKIVTWTMNSKHLGLKKTDALAIKNPNWVGKALAFDIALLKIDGKTPHWNIKENINENDYPDYYEASLIGHSIGLDAGGLWKNKQDFPHYQYDPNRVIFMPEKIDVEEELYTKQPNETEDFIEEGELHGLSYEAKTFLMKVDKIRKGLRKPEEEK